MGALDLVLPESNERILVPHEEVFFEQRYHSAVLLRPTFELMAVLTLVVFVQLDVSLVRNVVFGLFAVGALVYLIVRARKRKWSRRRWIQSLVVFAIVAFVLGGFDFTPDGVTWALVGMFAWRWVHDALRWRWYRRLLVTNRRIVEIDGFVSSRSASMPLFRVTDAVLNRSAAGQVLGYGHFRIESAGQIQGLGSIPFLARPERFHKLIIELSATAQTDVPATAWM